MCGRYLYLAEPDELIDEFGLAARPDGVGKAYNVAPSHLVAVVGDKPDGSGRGLVTMRWGFVPRWAGSPKDGPRPINARAETAAANPAFRDSFRGRRCLIPASGFYEWLRTDAGKVPHVFRPAAGVIAFAGLWDVWAPKSADPLYTCVILTVPANAATRFCHDRMPAILPRERYAAWLDRATPAAEVARLLTPAADGLLAATALSPAVNSVRNAGPECLTPAA